MIVSKRTKTCKHCGVDFLPFFNTTQQGCSIACCTAIGKAKTIKDAAKAERKDTAERKAKLKTRSDWLSEAQDAFNAFIRIRDHDKPCISCQRYHTGKWNAGHFLSVGAHPELRFNEFNVHKQCEPCNTNLSGNISKYRRNLVATFGQARVEEHEGYHPPMKYTIEDAQRIKAEYKAKTKALLAAREINQETA